MASGTGQPRTYSISGETSAGNLNRRRLRKEIEDAVTITATLDYMNSTGDVLDIYFDTTLTAGEITALDALLAAHTGPNTSSGYQFWELNPAESTLLQTWQTAMTRTASALAQGTYKFSWYFELRVVPVGPLNSRAAARFRIDANIKGSVAMDKDDWVAYSGWDRYVAEEAETPVVDIQFRQDDVVGGNDSIEIRKMKMSIERIP